MPHDLPDADLDSLYRLQSLLLDRKRRPNSDDVRSLAAVQIGLVLARIEGRKFEQSLREAILTGEAT